MVDDLPPAFFHFVYEVFGSTVIYVSAFMAGFLIIMLVVMMAVSIFDRPAQ